MGDKGPTGDIGEDGNQGWKGDVGKPGLRGPVGDSGYRGVIGATGDMGEKGHFLFSTEKRLIEVVLCSFMQEIKV